MATQSKTGSRSSSRRYQYTKVRDDRKHPIRGLWKRNGSYFARTTVEDDAGAKALKWVALDEATTAAEAQEAFRKLLVERRENRLPHRGRCPTFAAYPDQTYLPRLATLGKKADTLVTEKGHLKK